MPRTMESKTHPNHRPGHPPRPFEWPTTEIRNGQDTKRQSPRTGVRGLVGKRFSSGRMSVVSAAAENHIQVVEDGEQRLQRCGDIGQRGGVEHVVDSHRPVAVDDLIFAEDSLGAALASNSTGRLIT